MKDGKYELLLEIWSSQEEYTENSVSFYGTVFLTQKDAQAIMAAHKVLKANSKHFSQLSLMRGAYIEVENLGRRAYTPGDNALLALYGNKERLLEDIEEQEGLDGAGFSEHIDTYDVMMDDFSIWIEGHHTPTDSSDSTKIHFDSCKIALCYIKAIAELENLEEAVGLLGSEDERFKALAAQKLAA